MNSSLPLGICAGPQNADAVTAASADFIEVNVQEFLLPLEEDDTRFMANLSVVEELISVQCANCFLPGSLPCVGPAVDTPRLLAYAGRAFVRAARAGIECIVFGSGAARNVPVGFPMERAHAQFIQFLREIAPLAERAGVTVVVEPLNSNECNLVNTLEQGAGVVETCGHPNIALLGDSFHMGFSEEGPETVRRFGKYLRHFHVAEYPSRRFPGADGQSYQSYFEALRDVEYKGRVSVEAKWENFAPEAKSALVNLRRDRAAAGL